ncbi:MAG: PfkB family carbohydrate kinase [Rhodoglobus sp.]
MTVARLVSLGNVVIDLVMRIDALPEHGSDVIADSASITPGGAFNTLVAAARQGLPTVYAGAHGTGPFGDLARQALGREGIGVALSPVPDRDTGFDVALVDATAERTFVTSVGAEGQLAFGSFAFRPDDAIHISGYGLLHPVNREAILSLALPGTVFYDPGPLGPDTGDLAIDWWSGNAREATLATGIDDALEAAAVLATRVRRGAIVRLGAGGCILADPMPQIIPGFAVEAVDLNGAGDAHVGGFIAALATGLSPADAARRANAVAAIAVTRHGPADSPTAAETDAFLASAGLAS